MVVAACVSAGTHGQAAAAAPAAAFPPRAPARLQHVQQQPTCSSRRLHAQQQGRKHTIWQRQRCSAATTAGSSSAAASAEPGPEVPPSAQELAEAEALLREFVEGMGASGELSRPEDLDLPGEGCASSGPGAATRCCLTVGQALLPCGCAAAAWLPLPPRTQQQQLLPAVFAACSGSGSGNGRLAWHAAGGWAARAVARSGQHASLAAPLPRSFVAPCRGAADLGGGQPHPGHVWLAA